MGRVNKLAKMVFGSVVGTDTKKSQFETFLTSRGVEPNVIEIYKQMYKDNLIQVMPVIQNLSEIEILIVQLRCREDIRKEMKLSLLTKPNGMTYVYARTTFYRIDRDIPDIRVVIGDITKFGENSTLESLSEDPEFLEICYTKLYEVMTKEIEDQTTKIQEKVLNDSGF